MRTAVIGASVFVVLLVAFWVWQKHVDAEDEDRRARKRMEIDQAAGEARRQIERLGKQ